MTRLSASPFANVKSLFARLCKKPIKALLQRVLLKNDTPIVVASIGRSGSTMLFDAILDAQIKTSPMKRLLRRLKKNTAWQKDFSNFINGCTYKTHIFPEVIYPQVKYVYIYTRNFEALCSLETCLEKYGHDWIKLHMEHLDQDSDAFFNLRNGQFSDDPLGFNTQNENWFHGAKSNKNIFIISLDDLWRRLDKLEAFLALDITLPQKRQPHFETRPDIKDRFKDYL